MYSAADESGTTIRNLDRFVALQKIDGPTDGRLLVQVYRSDFSGVLDQGWVDATATGPALPPQMRVPSPDHSSAFHTSTIAQSDFLSIAAQAARQAAATTGVPASVTVAQAILESDWGRSSLAQDANNYFGIKAMGTLGNDGVVWLPTSEYDDSGQLYQTTSAFRAYKSLADSVTDHDLLLEQAARYAPAMRVANDPRQFAQQLSLDGYSTDPAYADKLIALMDRYNLHQLDT
jgi:flagellum-specific peptidoglycan hydrolase FlgJ